jgi:hypothetical protein
MTDGERGVVFTDSDICLAQTYDPDAGWDLTVCMGRPSDGRMYHWYVLGTREDADAAYAHLYALLSRAECVECAAENASLEGLGLGYEEVRLDAERH